MAITVWPVNSPLTQLRAQGIDVKFNRCRLMVFHRPNVTTAIRDFITNNAESIADELHLEAYYTKNPDPLGYSASNNGDVRISQGVLFWGWHVDHPTRIALGGQPTDFRDDIPDEYLGVLFNPGG